MGLTIALNRNLHKWVVEMPGYLHPVSGTLISVLLYLCVSDDREASFVGCVSNNESLSMADIGALWLRLKHPTRSSLKISDRFKYRVRSQTP
jgi:hypothetical protein